MHSFPILTEPVIYPTDAPIPKKRFIAGKLKLSKEEYIKEYNDKRSAQYRNMADRIETAVSISVMDEVNSLPVFKANHVFHSLYYLLSNFG